MPTWAGQGGWHEFHDHRPLSEFVEYESIAEGDGTMPAGLYVVRVTVDPVNHIRETNEADNVGYTLIRVVDGGGPGLDTVEECETGLGASPWDSNRSVIGDRFDWAKLAADPGYVAPACR